MLAHLRASQVEFQRLRVVRLRVDFCEAHVSALVAFPSLLVGTAHAAP